MGWIHRLLGLESAELDWVDAVPEYEAALTVLPRKPFETWLKSWSSGPNEDLASLRVADDSTVYLIPTYTGSWDEEALLEHVFAEVFEHELAAWCEDADLWPTQRDLSTFRKWFDVVWHSAVVDLR